MANVQIQDIRKLRERTGCGMMECKQALSDAHGSIEDAYRLLREKGLAKLEKKQHRITTEGMVALFTNATHTAGALVEVNTETDFAAKNPEFIDFSEHLACIAVQQQISSPSELLATKYRKSQQKVSDVLGDLVGKIGENITVRRIVVLQTNTTGLITGYSHMRGKISTLIRFSHVTPENKELLIETGRDIAMHTTAAAPRYVDKTAVDADVVAKERSIIEAALAKENKPADKIPMIAQGKMAKFYEAVCLLQQKYVKDPQQTVGTVIKTLDSKLVLEEFSRMQLGDGLEKKEDNFAEEVARQLQDSSS